MVCWWSAFSVSPDELNILEDKVVPDLRQVLNASEM